MAQLVQAVLVVLLVILAPTPADITLVQVVKVMLWLALLIGWVLWNMPTIDLIIDRSIDTYLRLYWWLRRWHRRHG